MKQLLTLSKNDFKNTFRDPMFRFLLFFPFISFAIVYWAVPAIEEVFPPITPFKPVILMWACLQSATMFGFIYGFLFLEEKEEGIWQAVRLLPISGIRLVFSRLLVGLIVSFLANFIIIYFGGIASLSLPLAFLLAALFSLSTLLIALWLGAMSRNKIEGMAQMKIMNLVLILPGILYFMPYKFLHFTALVPTYWSFRSLEMAIDSSSKMYLFVAVSIAFHAVAIYLLNKKLQNTVS